MGYLDQFKAQNEPNQTRKSGLDNKSEKGKIELGLSDSETGGFEGARQTGRVLQDEVAQFYLSKDDPKWQQFINRLKTLYFAGDAKILIGHPKRVKARTKCALLDPRILLEFPERAKEKFQERMNEHPECVLLLYKDDVILYPEERIQILNTQQGLF